VLLSSKYDEGLANVNRKLEDLSSALQSLLESNKTNNAGQASRPPVSPSQLLEGALASPPPEGDVPYEGDSSFLAHSRQITESLEFALSTPRSTPGDGSQSIDQKAIQKLLQEVAAAQSPKPAPTQQPFTQYPELATRTLPPMDLILKLLKQAKTGMNRWFLEMQIMKLDDFSTLCQRIYFPTEDYSVYDWINVNGGLFCLFRDVDGDLHEKLGVPRAEMVEHIKLCRNNVDTAIHCLRLCIEPSLDACQSLTVGASIAMEDGKVSNAWRLTSTASRMCLDLGLHRLPDGDNDAETRRKRLIFWYVYSLDKGLAFNFGRTPTIHDYDITTARPSLSADVDESWIPLYQTMLDFSILQGDIYAQLFSVSAQRVSVEVRVQRARSFAQKLNGLRPPMIEVGAKLHMLQRKAHVPRSWITRTCRG
jgi:hypothetical protein